MLIDYEHTTFCVLGRDETDGAESDEVSGFHWQRQPDRRARRAPRNVGRSSPVVWQQSPNRASTPWTLRHQRTTFVSPRQRRRKWLSDKVSIRWAGADGVDQGICCPGSAEDRNSARDPFLEVSFVAPAGSGNDVPEIIRRWIATGTALFRRVYIRLCRAPCDFRSTVSVCFTRPYL